MTRFDKNGRVHGKENVQKRPTGKDNIAPTTPFDTTHLHVNQDLNNNPLIAKFMRDADAFAGTNGPVFVRMCDGEDKYIDILSKGLAFTIMREHELLTDWDIQTIMDEGIEKIQYRWFLSQNRIIFFKQLERYPHIRIPALRIVNELVGYQVFPISE